MPSKLATIGIEALARADWEAAELAFAEALEVDLQDVDANLGMAKMALDAGYPEDVHGFTGQVIPMDPRGVELEYLASRAMGRHDRAFSDALRQLVGPIPAGFRYRLGSDLLADARYADAMAVFSKAVEQEPGNHLMLGGLAAACYGLGRIDECRKAVKKRVRAMPRDPQIFAHWIALHAGMASMDTASFRELSGEWERKFGMSASSGLAVNRPSYSVEGSRIRVGFLSTTFRHHANCQFLLPLLEELDRKRIALYAYHGGSFEDSVTQKCRGAVDVFRKVHGMADASTAKLIFEDEIDVLVDINAHFDDARMQILCHRPAPVIVHYLGGVGTTGLSCVDWRIADELTEPPDQPDIDCGPERIHRIEGGIHVFRPLCATADPGELPAHARGHLTFGCLNALAKIEDPVLELWGRCLQAVPGSRLRLVKQAFRHVANVEDFCSRAQRLGVDVARVDLVPADEQAFDDLSVYHGIDIALDTFAYNGITTTCEALWMGVPVVTLRGERFVAREAAAILSRVGYSEWIAGDPDEYVDVARQLAGDLASLSEIRQRLRAQFAASPLGDAKRLAWQFESFLAHALGKDLRI